jgi:hypothetical protein
VSHFPAKQKTTTFPGTHNFSRISPGLNDTLLFLLKTG